MEINITNPKIWAKLSERNLSISNKIKIYEKLGGAYKIHSNASTGGQVFNKLVELLKFSKDKRPLPEQKKNAK